MRVVLGVSGGIAAYKAATLLRRFREAGHDVTVVPTAAALRFVGAPTWEALSGRSVATEVFSDVPGVAHVRIGQQAELIIVAPATADLLARAAHGLADDLLTATLLTASCPVILAPAMHTEMWEHPATRANVATLRDRGVHVIEPASGRLTGADSGPGRLPEPDELYAAALAVLDATDQAAARRGALVSSSTADVATADVAAVVRAGHPLAGRRVLVTAGGTREPLDPVRYLGNRSSGKQGYAFAASAIERGAEVTIVAANTALTAPAGAVVVPVETALELKEAVDRLATSTDVVVMAAAVADFRPANRAAHKIKKSHNPVGAGGAAGMADTNGDDGAGDSDESAPTIELVRNPDILRGLVQRRGSAGTPVIIGFAAETGDESGSVLDLARAKLARKGCDVLVANEVGEGVAFGTEENTVQVLLRPGLTGIGGDGGGGGDFAVGPAPKRQVADQVWDRLAAVLAALGVAGAVGESTGSPER